MRALAASLPGVPGVEAPNVFAYTDYRQYLAAYYAFAKSERYGFSFRVFSKRAGLRSTNYLKLVIDGQRNLSRDMAARFATGCELSGAGAEYFCELVEYAQARTTAEKSRVYERLGRFRLFREARRLDGAHGEYHQSWFVPVVRELARRADFQEDPKWLARQLVPAISVAEAKKALATLLELGLLERDESGRLVQSTPLVTTGPGPLGHHIYAFHQAMLDRAKAALDQLPREERDISNITVCVSQSKLEELKQRVRAFRRELLLSAELDDTPERVVQINFQLFPLSAAPGAAATETPSRAAAASRQSRRSNRS